LGLALIYFKQMQANLRQAHASECQLGEMQRTLMLEQRAWITLAGPGFQEPYSREHFQFWIKTRNTGKTPANIGQMEFSVGICDPQFSKTNIISREIKPGPGPTVAPGADYAVGTFARWPIDEDQFNQLRNKQLVFIFSVSISYKDAFGYIRHTEACWALTGDPEQYYGGGRVFDLHGSGRMD
jgi:hypothetical protein